MVIQFTCVPYNNNQRQYGANGLIFDMIVVEEDDYHMRQHYEFYVTSTATNNPTRIRLNIHLNNHGKQQQERRDIPVQHIGDRELFFRVGYYGIGSIVTIEIEE